MSYEGYVVSYCSMGHRVDIRDAYDAWETDGAPICKVCGRKAVYHDSVDQTNGCECDLMSKEEKEEFGKCAAHETVEKILTWNSMSCAHCNATGNIEITTEWSWELCPDCKGKTSGCKTCQDRSVVPVAKNTQRIPCPSCFGSTMLRIEVWDIAALRAKCE